MTNEVQKKSISFSSTYFIDNNQTTKDWKSLINRNNTPSMYLLINCQSGI